MQYCLITAGVRAPLLLLMMMPSFLSLLSDDLQIRFLSLWLDVRSLSTLDVAISCHRLRPRWITLLQCLRSPAVDDWGHSLSSLMWLSKRGIRASRVQMTKDTSRVRVCEVLQVDTSDLVALGLRLCFNTTNQCVMDIINRCPKLRSINLAGCNKVTDDGVSALGAGCGQLQSIDLAGCEKVTDAGISALGAGCGQLQIMSILFYYVNEQYCASNGKKLQKSRPMTYHDITSGSTMHLYEIQDNNKVRAMKVVADVSRKWKSEKDVRRCER